jgi:hypothetical protein
MLQITLQQISPNLGIFHVISPASSGIMRNIQEWEIVVGELPQTTLRFSEVFRYHYIGIVTVLFFFSFVTYQAFLRLVTKFAICFCSKFPSGACNVLEARVSVIKFLVSLFCREISELTFQRYGSTGTR